MTGGSPVKQGPGRDPVVEAYKKDVDRTLLVENLERTPHERVLALIRLQRVAREARAAGKRLEVIAELEALRETQDG